MDTEAQEEKQAAKERQAAAELIRAYRAGVKFRALRMAKAVYHNWDMAATRGAGGTVEHLHI